MVTARIIDSQWGTVNETSGVIYRYFTRILRLVIGERQATEDYP